MAKRDGIMTELTPGQLLAACREQRGLSQADVAKQMHLSLQTVKDLEHDEYDHVGVRTFVRGYLCTYARLINFPEARVLEAFEQLDIPAFEEQIVPVSLVIEQTGNRKVISFTDWLRRTFGLVFLALLGVLFWHFLQGHDNNQQSKAQSNQQAQVQKNIMLKQPIESFHLIKSSDKS